jgi:TPR repeat protein
MNSLDTFSLSSILCVTVITAIIFAVSKWSNTEADSKAKADKNSCASCGIAGGDDVKLEKCTDCKSVQYCSDKCREKHREQHDEECKIWVKALHDRKLFTQPESTHLGECPICFLPLPLDPQKHGVYSCCSKVICNGCIYANRKSKGDQIICLFCRERTVSEEESRKNLMKRVKANDPAALRRMGRQCYDEESAFEYMTKAAELGDLEARFDLGLMYYKRARGGVEVDMKKAVYHWEKAAIGGNPFARHNLACIEEENGNIERAVKHFIIAANLGYDVSMKALWDVFKTGYISKDDLAATLRLHQAALDAMKSPHRDAAEAAL